MKKKLTMILALMLALAMVLSACGSSSNNTTTTAAPESTKPTETTEPATTTKPSVTTEEPTDSEQKEIYDMLVAGLSGGVASLTASDEEFGADKVITSNYLITGLIPKLEELEVDELDEAGAAEMDRAARAFTPQDEVEIINNAEYFWFYEHMTENQQLIYDAMLVLGQDPTSTENAVSFQSKVNPNTNDFAYDFYIAWLGLGFDHPEMWWMYYWNGTTSLNASFDTRKKNGAYTIYVFFEEAYDTFEEDVMAFNEAFEEFYDQIYFDDCTDEEIVLQIHDLLIDQCIYDMAICEEDKLDFGHTAFGPYVSNTDGTPHYCVCDGYAMAFEYACQMCGIMATVCTGMVEDMGGHAWSMVLLDNYWYELDVCWDDQTDVLDEVLDYYGKNSIEYKVYAEIYSDDAFLDKLFHAYFLLSTDEINNYKAPSYLTYTSKQGYRVRFGSDSKRERWATYSETKDYPQGMVTALLPVADGRLCDEYGEPLEDAEPDDNDWGYDEDFSQYASLVGTYYVSSFNGYGEAILKQYYGAKYYEQLSMFDLKADGSGVIYEDGSTFPFNYIFDGTYLYMFSTGGGSLIFTYNAGSLTWIDNYGNTYVFSKLK